MCGIAGAPDRETVESLIESLEHRGFSSKIDGEEYFLGHRLHAVVGDVEQPLEGEGVLTANCEIYNWRELNEKYGWDTENDAETLLRLLDEKGVDALNELDGVYAFGYIRDGKLMIARDLLGVKPVWYSGPMFASEKQALESQGMEPRELHPRQILEIDLETGEQKFARREFFEIDVDEKTLDDAAEEIRELFLDAVEKRLPEGELTLLFSGGVDSTMIAAALKELDKEFTCYTAGIQHGNTSKPRDVEWAERVAEKMDLDLEVHESSLEEVEGSIPDIVEWISSTSVVKTGVALPFHLALNGTEKVVFSGLGSEQLYAGYSRQQGYLNRECLSGLRGLFERDLYRDDVISMRNGYELRVPFLDSALVEHAMTIPADYKKRDEYRKYVLRLAAEKLGVPEEVAWRKKTAAQYGSNFDKALNRLAKDRGLGKQEYVNSFGDKPNNHLAALTSGGKDSNAALYRMKKRNNDISCLVNIRSENLESYMFDSKKSPDEIERQAEILDTPLLVWTTEGEKEVELEDLEKALAKAVEEYGVEGVVAGALASTYQRDRVEEVAEKLGLKVFAPLWQEDQSRYMKWLVREGFKVEITSVAARGLNEEWVGTVLDEGSLGELLELAEKYGFNPAGEGGEYETRVVEFPESV